MGAEESPGRISCAEDSSHVETQSDSHGTEASEEDPLSPVTRSPSADCHAAASAKEDGAGGETHDSDDHASS